MIALAAEWDYPNEPGPREEIAVVQLYCHSGSTLLVLKLCSISLNSRKPLQQAIPALVELLSHRNLCLVGKQAQGDIRRLA